jgi:hopanoid biosynthesis associated RND transporter like protein HpnN
MSRSLAVLLRLSTARPWATIALCLALAGGALLYTAKALSFETSSVRLLPQSRVYVQEFQRYLGEFGELNDIVIVVESEDIEQAKEYAARLADELTRPPLSVARATYRIDPDRFGGRALLYLSTEQLADLRDRVAEHREFLEEYAAHPTLARLVESVNREIARRFAGRFVDLGLGEPARLDPSFVDALLAAIGERLESPRPRPSPWTELFAGAGEARSGYFTSGDGKLLFMLVEPRREAGNFTDNKDVIAGIRRTIAGLRAAYPAVTAGVTGTPALSNDEMLTAFRDSAMATTLAAVVTLGVVLLTFRRVTKPLLMFGVLLVSLAWSLGLIALIVGHLTIFSVMFISLFIGLGIDYGIYLLFRYEEELGLAGAPRPALATAVGFAGPGILFAGLSAAGTFGVLMLTEFRGIVEFGFIGGLAILMALVAMLTLLPAVLLVLDRRRAFPPPATPEGTGHRPGVRLLERVTLRSRAVVGAAAVLTVYSVFAVTAVGFDYNRLNLQAKGTESVVWEQKIMASGRSAFPALASARSLDELRAKQEAFARLPTVSDVVSVLKVIPTEQAEKIAIIRDLAPTVAPVRVAAAQAEDPEALRAALMTLRSRLGLAIREAGPEGPSTTLRSADDRARRLLERLGRGGAEARRRLYAIQAEFRRDFSDKLRRFQTHLAPRPVTLDDLPEDLRRKFVGRNGTLIMQVSPAVNTWDRAGVEQFVADVRTVDPAVTGSPVISYEASRMMEQAYFEGTFYAVLLVLVLAGIMLRRAGDTLLAVLPMVLGTLWTVGFMRVAGLSFNLANVWALPLIIGASAEYGLNVALRHREAMEHGGPVLARSTVLAVVLNGLTTIAGFGSLMLARHQGIFGLGLLLTVGAVAGLAASLIVLPVLLRLFGRVGVPVRTGLGLPETSMTRKRLCVLVVLLASIPFAARPAAAGEPTDRVRSAVDEMYRLLSPAAATSGRDHRERDTAAARVMDQLFDWRAMARQSLRQHWEQRTAVERDEFTRLFAELFRRAYLTRISLVEASAFKYLGDTITGDRATVTTQVRTKRGSLIGVTYAVSREDGRSWRVQDVLVEGISLLDNYRTQFASIIARSSYEALIERLRMRVKEQS